MTSPKSVSWSALVNVGNNESIALTVSGEAANPDEARDIFAFACGQLLGVANSADVDTAALIRAYVSRLVQTEEARPVVQEAPAPVKEPAMLTPPVAAPAPKVWIGEADPTVVVRLDQPIPSVAEQVATAVATCIKPPAPEDPKPAPAGSPLAQTAGPICEACGAVVTKSQEKLSQLFMSKTLCKKCQAEASA